MDTNLNGPVQRDDGAYANAFLAMGTSRDRTAYTQPVFGNLLTDQTLESLYMQDGMARRVIDIYAEELLRAGFVVEGLAEEDELHAELERLDANRALVDALRWEGLFGGAMVVLIVQDGGTLEMPLKSGGKLEALRVYDKREVMRNTYYNNPSTADYGKVATYRISPQRGMSYVVHESRCLVFNGMPAPNTAREQNDGWGMSRLQGVYDQLTRANTGHYWANALLERAQQAVHGIPELTLQLADKGGVERVRQRIGLVDMARSVNNTVVIDALETYELKSTPLSGIEAILDRFGLALASVAGIPEGVLYGRQQAGLNSTGKAELETWYSRIKQEQKTRLMPQLTKLVNLLLGRGVKVTFGAMNVLSELEQSEVELKRAQGRSIYYNAGVLSPLEMRQTLAGEGFPLENVDQVPPSPQVAQSGGAGTSNGGDTRVR